MPRPLHHATTWLLAGLALAGPAWGHGDEARDQPPPVKADFAPPVPGTYTLHFIMRAPGGQVVDLDGRDRRSPSTPPARSRC